MICLTLEDTKVSQFFKEAGYTVHKNGPLKGGYIRELERGNRWHAKIIEEKKEKAKVEIHYDLNIRGFHTLVFNKKWEISERTRLKNNPYYRITKPLYAANLKDIQRIHKSGIKIPFFKKIKMMFKSI